MFQLQGQIECYQGSLDVGTLYC